MLDMFVRTPASNPERPKSRAGSRLVQSIRDGGALFELSYVKCGKRPCKCNSDHPDYDQDRPGHGPYWYRVIMTQDGRKVRRYIGKTLYPQKKAA